MTLDEKLDLLINEVQGMKQDVSGLKQDVSELKHNVSSLEQKQLKTQLLLETDIAPKVNNLENQVKLNTITVENAVNKCIQVMGEGYQLNAERFDRLDIDAVKNKADIAFSMSQLANEKIDRLIEKLNQSA